MRNIHLHYKDLLFLFSILLNFYMKLKMGTLDTGGSLLSRKLDFAFMILVSLWSDIILKLNLYFPVQDIVLLIEGNSVFFKMSHFFCPCLLGKYSTTHDHLYLDRDLSLVW